MNTEPNHLRKRKEAKVRKIMLLQNFRDSAWSAQGKTSDSLNFLKRPER
jgi:hypothetical protein